MKINNFAFDLAAERAEQERQAGIRQAQAALNQPGEVQCIDCGVEISLARRQVMPSAIRCHKCQTFFEKGRKS